MLTTGIYWEDISLPPFSGWCSFGPGSGGDWRASWSSAMIVDCVREAWVDSVPYSWAPKVWSLCLKPQQSLFLLLQALHLHPYPPSWEFFSAQDMGNFSFIYRNSSKSIVYIHNSFPSLWGLTLDLNNYNFFLCILPCVIFFFSWALNMKFLVEGVKVRGEKEITLF